MPTPRDLNDRRNLTSRHRLRGFDYQNPGYYFITICTHERRRLLGQVESGLVVLSDAGEMVRDVIERVPLMFRTIELDSHVIMPNHIHATIYLPLDGSQYTVSEVVRWIKGVSVSNYGKGVREKGWPPYDGKFWQSGFNDQIIRNDKHLSEVRRYIEHNPSKWEEDDLYGS